MIQSLLKQGSLFDDAGCLWPGTVMSNGGGGRFRVCLMLSQVVEEVRLAGSMV